MTQTAQAQRARFRGPSPRALRQLHLWVAVFSAPSIIFFAATGTIQVLGLHEASRDGTYRPAPIVEKLSQVHIHQRFAEPPRPPAPRAQGARTGRSDGAATRPAADGQPNRRRGPSLGTQLAKWFFAAAAIGLVTSSLLGVWIATTQSRDKRLAWILLAIGAVVPVLALAF